METSSVIKELAHVAFARLAFADLQDSLDDREELSAFPRLRFGATFARLAFACLQDSLED